MSDTTPSGPAADVEALLRPARLGSLALPHRIVMAPMTRSRANADGVPSELAREYYRQRASAALIITEATRVSEEATGYLGTPGIYTEPQARAWRRITDAVRAEGGRIFLQLWHVGRVSHPDFHHGALPVAPSAIRPDGWTYTSEGQRAFVQPRALESDEILRVVEDFRNAAALAVDAGFDGVEIHGANGYLIDQFLRNGSNRRTDRYGGSIENRLRFPLEVVDAVTEVWGAQCVGMRISPLSAFNDMWDSDPQPLFSAFARSLGDRKLAYLHVVRDDAFTGSAISFDPLTLGKLFSGPIIAASGYDATSGAAEVVSGRADLVAYARLFLANPDLPGRFADAAPLTEPDTATFYGGDAKGYIDYPFRRSHPVAVNWASEAGSTRSVCTGSTRILAITGSLRAQSTNTAVLGAVALLAPEDVQVAVFSGLDTLPYFNPDLDTEDSEPPASVREFRQRIQDADGLLICSPEYAHGVPGALKNALDWLVSVPQIVSKPVGLLNASPRSVHVGASLTETLRTMSLKVVPAASIEVPVSGRTVDAAEIAQDSRSAAVLRGALESIVVAAREYRRDG